MVEKPAWRDVEGNAVTKIKEAIEDQFGTLLYTGGWKYSSDDCFGLSPKVCEDKNCTCCSKCVYMSRAFALHWIENINCATNQHPSYA